MTRVARTLVVLLLLPRTGLADVTEDFLSPVVVSDGTTLGLCNQLTAALFGQGQITISGNGSASINTPAEVDVAMLYSTQALPSTYTVTAMSGNINFPQYTLENGVTLLAIVDTKPQPATDVWWSSHRMLSVEVTTTPGAANPYPIYINYFTATTFYTWNGTSWGAGDPNWVPAVTFDPTKNYKVTITKAAGTFSISITTGSTVLAQASVPVASVRPATTEHFVVGDRLSNFFKGNMKLKSVTQPKPPGCVLPDTSPVLDATPPVDAGPPVDLGPPLDGKSADTSSGDTTPDAATPDAATGDHPATLDLAPSSDGPTSTDRSSSWDLHTPDLGPVTPQDSDSGCGCAVHRTPPGGLVWLGLLGAFLMWFRRRT